MNLQPTVWAGTDSSSSLDDDAVGRASTDHPGLLAEFERLRAHLGIAEPPARVIDDRYRLERLLGQGAMGSVYLAWDLRLTAEFSWAEPNRTPLSLV